MEFLYLVGLATPAAVIAIIVLACNLSACKKESQVWENKYRRLVGLPLRGTDEIKKSSEGSLNLSDEARDRIQKELAYNMRMSDATKKASEAQKKQLELQEFEKRLKEQEKSLDARISTYKQENNSLRKIISDYESKIRFLESDKKSLEISLSIQKQTEKELRDEISKLRDLKSASEIDWLNVQLRSYKSSEERYKKEIAEKNATIKRLDDHLTFYKKEAEKAGEKHSVNLSTQTNLIDEDSISALYLDALNRLETGAERFYRYPTMFDFYERVKDKRFHRSQIENIEFLGSIHISATVRSETGAYHDTSLTRCNCTDYAKTKQPCKHMLFLAYHAGVLSVRKDLFENSMKIYFDKLRTTPVPKK
ncbi:MAG: SWIM zinc finger family protein [Clostridia bacterium]|nr:SWIM zinc finger family protein [Clostridia bacterium]